MTTATGPAQSGPHARLTGIVYLLFFAASFAVFPRAAMIVSTDAALTAQNILAQETLYRFTVASEIVSTAAYVAVILLLYELLKPVSRIVSLLAAFFGLVGCAITGANEVNLLAPLVLLGGTLHLTALVPAQLHELALIALRLYGQGYAVTLVFFGAYDFLLGVLIVRSTFLTRIIGVLLLIAGVTWIGGVMAVFLSPTLAKLVSPFVMASGILSEASLALWLTFVGVNVTKWKAAAGVP
jgi:hypothetical protein